MPSRSGSKGIIINKCERAVSGDINRVQALGGAALQEMLRYLLNVRLGTDDVDAGGLNLETVTNTVPPSAEVLGGLLVRPDPTGGTLGLQIDDGLLCMVDLDPTSSADDSCYKYCQSSGLALGTLTMQANPTFGSSGLRIDVIECCRIDDPNPEQDNRDIFNPATDLFLAMTVTKSTASTLQFRVRTGTAGGGFPGLVAEWVPLCVASVPVGALTNDAITFWDVRPMVSDRAFGVSSTWRDLPRVDRCFAQIDAVNYAGQSRLSGVIEAQLLERRVGGAMRASTPATASDDSVWYCDLDDAANQDAINAPVSGFNYVYLAVPFGLPRWARYTVGPAGRVPRSPRGMLIESSVPPDLVYGTPHAVIGLPPCLQDTGVTQTAAKSHVVCVMARIGTSTTARGVLASGRVHHSSTYTAPNYPIVVGNIATFTLVPGVDFPAHARAIHATFDLDYNFTAPATIRLAYSLGVTSVGIILPNFVPDSAQDLTSPDLHPTFRQNLRIPIASLYGLFGQPGSSTPGSTQTLQLIVSVVQTTGGPAALTGGGIEVQGWELLDAD